jgi:hypothetical protein
VDRVTISTNVTPVNNLVSKARLKKKDVKTKTSKHKRTWLDKKRKFTKKGTKKNEKGSMVCTTTKYITFSIDCNCINGKMLSYSSIIRRNNKMLKWHPMMVQPRKGCLKLTLQKMFGLALLVPRKGCLNLTWPFITTLSY